MHFSNIFEFLTIYWLTLTIFILFFIWFYNYVRQKHSYWSDRGVIGPKPIFLFGTEYRLALESWPKVTRDRYKQYGKMYGGYQVLTPFLFIQDPELIKTVLIKDFHCYTNRLKLRTYHEHFNENLFFSETQKWKRMRTITSRSFSSGKLKNVASMMNDCIDKLFTYFDNTIQQNNGQGLKIETKKVIAGFTMDVIAWSGFGTETNSNDDRQKENRFLVNGLELFKFRPFRSLASFTMPRFILNLLNIRVSNPPEAFEYFVNLTKEIIRQRKNLNVNVSKKPTDLLQLMLDAEVDEKELKEDNYDKLTITEENEKGTESSEQNGLKNGVNKTLMKMTETEAIANSIVFLLAGFETTSSTISHFLFELAWNPDIQEKLYHDLKNGLGDKDFRSMEYFDEIMNNQPYLEAVLKETLRRYPPVNVLNRRVSVDECKLNGVSLLKDTTIAIPVNSIHHCEEFYENPFKFDPNRWLPENKDKLVPYTYMPFGLGPRNCIGMRFAYQEIKLCLSRMIMKYRFETTDDTPRELSYSPRSPLLVTQPFNLKINKR